MKCQHCGGVVVKSLDRYERMDTLRCLNCDREHWGNGELKMGRTCKHDKRNCAICPYMKEFLCDYPYIGSKVTEKATL